MTYRIIQLVEGRLMRTEVSDIHAWLAVADVKITGTQTSRSVRPELYGEPKLKGYAGPMWDGDAIRYESQAACEMLSF